MRNYRVMWAGLVWVSACANPRESSGQEAAASTQEAAASAVETTCTVTQALQPLPEAVRETSGLAVSRRHAGVLWTHNDSGGEATIFALGTDGTLKGRVNVTGATLTDWEDLESGACEAGACLYIADTGDNAGRRDYVTIWEMTEPDLSATSTTARAIQARYADGPQDAEAMFRLPSGDMFVVTKGRHKSIKLYKYSTAGANGQGTLQLVREIGPKPTSELDRVTAATASPDGKWVAIRTYRNLFLYHTDDLLGSGKPATTYSLTSLQEKQGESLTLSDRGEVWVTSEAENMKDMPTLGRLSCTLR